MIKVNNAGDVESGITINVWWPLQCQLDEAPGTVNPAKTTTS